MNRRQFLPLTGAFFASLSPLAACLWDTDTLQDEIKVEASLFDLILGQVPHHGAAYYRKRIERLERQKDWSIDELNDLAVAHIRLKEFEPALERLEAALEMDPKRYQTISNRGIWAKKQGRFKESAEWITKALSVNPEGHMGLGDWYLKRLNWSAKLAEAAQNAVPSYNFLGQSYADAFKLSEYNQPDRKQLKRTKLHRSKYGKLLRNDQHFADGFLATGDFLIRQKHFHLAKLAHCRARMLDHPAQKEVERRVRLQPFGSESGFRADPRGDLPSAEFLSIFDKAQEWVTALHQKEAKLLANLDDERKAPLSQTVKALKADGIELVRP